MMELVPSLVLRRGARDGPMQGALKSSSYLCLCVDAPCCMWNFDHSFLQVPHLFFTLCSYECILHFMQILNSMKNDEGSNSQKKKKKKFKSYNYLYLHQLDGHSMVRNFHSWTKFHFFSKEKIQLEVAYNMTKLDFF